MNVPGEIARLTEIAEPDIAVITNVASVHLEGLGSIEGVAHAKGELFEGLGDKGTAIINDEDVLIKDICARSLGTQKKIYFGCFT